jgi:hypothetical protein
MATWADRDFRDHPRRIVLAQKVIRQTVIALGAGLLMWVFVAVTLWYVRMHHHWSPPKT